jgi:protein SCO1/2
VDRSRLGFVVVGAAAALSCRGSGGPREGGGPGDAASAEARVAGSRRRFANPVVQTHEGRAVRFYDDLVRGRLVLLGFAYTRCQGSCSASLVQLLRAREPVRTRLGHAPGLVTLTLDPAHDTPAVLAGYVAGHGSPPGWTFVTGAPEELERLRRFLGFTDPDPRVDSDRTQHAALVAIGDDRSGRWQIASTAAGATQVAGLTLRTAGARPSG